MWNAVAAGVFGIDHRNTTDAHFAQDHLPTDALLPSDEASHRIANRCRFKRTLIDIRGTESVLYRLTRQVLHAAVEMFGETRHACANKGNLSHVVFLPGLKLSPPYPHSPLFRKANFASMGAYELRLGASQSPRFR